MTVVDLKAINELAYKHLANRKSHLHREKGFIYYHGQRVANIVLELRQRLFPDDDSHDQVLTVAAYFHDIAKGIEPHSYYGSIIVKELLQDYCSEDELYTIAEIIKHHQFRDPNKNFSDLIRLIQDADTLDHFGTVEIWMNFNYYANNDGTMLDSVDYYSSEKFEEITATCRSLLNYDLSVQIFDEKLHFVKEFARRMKLEAQGKIVS